MKESDIHTIAIYQKEYFSILKEFFIGVTGKHPKDFCETNNFSEAANELGERFGGNKSQLQKAYQAYVVLEEKLKKLYGDESSNCFQSAKEIDCCKVNLGGSSRFLETQLNATRKSILFSDIVLIPDPVLPWLETKREHEKFRMTHTLEAAYFILQLNNMVTDNFELPPFLVFPSWEKSLEENDQTTILTTKQLVRDLFVHYVEPSIKSIEDVFTFANSDEKEFLKRIDAAKLFIAPDGEIDDPINQAIKNYREYAKTYRTKDFNEMINSVSDGTLVINGFFERIQPQYHILENS